MGISLPKTIPAVVLAALVVFTAGREGLRTTAYKDVGGVPTICYGDTTNVHLGQVTSAADCRVRLNGDLSDGYQAMGRHVTVALNIGEQEAFTDFVYNVGEGNFARSTLVRKLNHGDHKGACAELLKWVYVQVGNKQVVSDGLKNRRNAEYQLCMKGN